MAKNKQRRILNRKPLPLPYNNRPAASTLRLDPSLHTAAELMAAAHDPAA